MFFCFMLWVVICFVKDLYIVLEGWLYVEGGIVKFFIVGMVVFCILIKFNFYCYF